MKKKRKDPVPKYNGSKPMVSLCSCGHIGDCPGSDHEDGPAGQGVYQIGHGKCKIKDCKCEHFTWKGFL